MTTYRRVNMLTRVEGHGSVELIRTGARVTDARFHLYESPRLFEALLVGRRFDEIADIACRICSICSTVHKVAALQAVERALGVATSRQTALLRELAVQGGQIESHALYIFCLALPDYLGVHGFQEMTSSAPEILKTGLKIKKIGNHLQETIGGRAIHPFNLLVGGVGRVPETDALSSLSQQLAGVMGEVAGCIPYICNLKEILPPLSTGPFCAVSGGSSLFGDYLATSTGETVPAQTSVGWFNELIEPHTHAKVSGFRGSDTYIVGPLARILLSMPAGYAGHFADTSIRSSLKARVVELQLAVTQADAIIRELLDAGVKKEPPVAAALTEGVGTSLVEAPRGTLLHRYCFDGRGICTAADIITPTAINQGAIAASLQELVRTMDGAEYGQIRSAAEVLVRCFDPCISCAVH